MQRRTSLHPYAPPHSPRMRPSRYRRVKPSKWPTPGIKANRQSDTQSPDIGLYTRDLGLHPSERTISIVLLYMQLWISIHEYYVKVIGLIGRRNRSGRSANRNSGHSGLFCYAAKLFHAEYYYDSFIKYRQGSFRGYNM